MDLVGKSHQSKNQVDWGFIFMIIGFGGLFLVCLGIWIRNCRRRAALNRLQQNLGNGNYQNLQPQNQNIRNPYNHANLYQNNPAYLNNPPYGSYAAYPNNNIIIGQPVPSPYIAPPPPQNLNPYGIIENNPPLSH